MITNARTRQHPDARLVTALALSWVGFAWHELQRVPDAYGLTGSLPMLAVGLIPLWLAWRHPHSRLPGVLLVGYAVLNLIGGVVTVLPLPILPFDPEQTFSHYATHTVWSIAQIPLLVLASRAATMSAGARPEPDRRSGAW